MCNTRISANPPTEVFSVGAPQMLQDAISHTEAAGATASYSWWPPTAAGPCGGHRGTAAIALEEAKPGSVLRTLSQARLEEGSTVRGSRAFTCTPGYKHRLRMRQWALR